MTEEPLESLAITIGDQVFRIRVTPEDRERFERVARSADRALRDVLDSGPVGGVRAMAMALFQLALELEEARDGMRRIEAARQRLAALAARIEAVPGVAERR